MNKLDVFLNEDKYINNKEYKNFCEENKIEIDEKLLEDRNKKFIDKKLIEYKDITFQRFLFVKRLLNL